MNPLNERLDEIGWADTTDQPALRAYRAMFNWMQQATVEIDRLTHEVEVLTRQHAPDPSRWTDAHTAR